MHARGLDVGLRVQPAKDARVVTVGDAEPPHRARRHEALHRSPAPHGLGVRRQGRVQHEAINVRGAQISQGGGHALLDLILERCGCIIRYPIWILSGDRREFGLEIDIGTRHTRLLECLTDARLVICTSVRVDQAGQWIDS